MSKVLILTDGKAGHENQSKAFARALGCDFDVVPVFFRSKFTKAVSYLADRAGVRSSALYTSFPQPEQGKYRAVLGTGSGVFYAVKVLARRLGVPSGVVLYPRGYALTDFNCILAPTFDRPATAPNIIQLPANLVATDAAFYDTGVKDFLENSYKRPFDGTVKAVGVIIGGPNKCSTLTPAWMKQQLDRIFAENSGSELWVTTSRRTPPEIEAVVVQYPWAYRLLYSKDQFNPIPAFVKLAQRLYVTAESTGMLSEACTFGTAEVHALDNLKPGPHKFRRFVEGLIQAGYVNGSRKVDLSDQFARASDLLGL